MSRSCTKHIRQQKEYNAQQAGLRQNEEQFRKIARQQLQAAAARRAGVASLSDTSSTSDRLPQLASSGIRSLRMTDELCGLFDKINRTRKMLREKEWSHGHQLLRK